MGPFRFRDGAAATVWALAMAVGAFLFTVPKATGGAALGAFVGYALGILLEKSRIKLAPGLILLAIGSVLAGLIFSIPQDSSLVANLLGAENTFVIGEISQWFSLCLFFVMTLRFLSGRFPSMVSLEVIAVALIMSSPLAAHRHGFINRPYFLVDPLWSQNQDPIPILLGVGALSAAVLVILAMGRRTRRSSIIDVLLLLGLIGGLYLLLPERTLRNFTQDPNVLGLKDSDKKGKPKEKGKDTDKDKEKSKDKDDSMPMGKPPPDDPEQKLSPIAVVLLRDDYDPPLGMYYFRQSAFSQYNGKRLVADTTGLHDTDLIDSFPTEETPIKSAVVRNPAAFSTLHTFVALMETHGKPFGMVDADKLGPADNPDPDKFVRAFEVESQVITVKPQTFLSCKAGNSEWNQEDWKYYTAAPADPRYKQLSDKILSADPQSSYSAFTKALAIKLYLDKTVTYTMNADHSLADDPVADYLFENPRGYCVHQAHAAVYLMRAAGLPARVGVGYATEARNRAGGSTIMLRSGEAHAWPEVFLDGVGWFIMDITADKSDAQEMKQPDPGLQRMLGEMARKKEKKDKEDKDKFTKRDLREPLRWLAIVLLCLLALALAGTVVGLYAWKYYRRFEPLWCGPKRLGIAAMRSGLDQLAEVGELRRYGESRLDFARRSGYESLIALTEYHYDAVYGRDETAAKRFLQLREQLHQQIVQRHSVGQRLLGFLSAISWMRVR